MVSWLILIPKGCIICEEDLPKRKALRVRQSLFIIHISKYCILFFKVIIHDPGSIPMTSGGGAVLQPGTNTNLILSRWEMIRQPAPYTSNCTQNWGPEFTFFAGNRSYDSKLCQSFCFSKVLIDLCGCELVKMMEIFPGKFNLYLNSPIFQNIFVISDEGVQRNYCNLLDEETIHCLHPLLTSDDFEHIMRHCVCAPQCHQVNYKTER